MIKIYIISCCLWLHILNIIAQNIEQNNKSVVESRQNDTWDKQKSANNNDSAKFILNGEGRIYTKESDFRLPIERSFVTNLVTPYMEIDNTFTFRPLLSLLIQGEISKPKLYFLYSYSYDSMIESMDVKGFQSCHPITEYLSAKLDLYISKHHFGNLISPNYYINGSVRAQLLLNVTERVQLTGEGQLSLRKGIDPEISSLIGGANYYGAGIKIKLTNRVGIGFGFANNYFRGKWTKRSYVSPIGY